MFRATTYVLAARANLSRRPLLGDYQHAAISIFSPNYKYKDPKERAPCPALPPPPPPPPKDERLFWGALTVLCIAGGFAVYAKRQPEIRDWLTIQCPWFDDIIAVLYQENMTYAEFANQCLENLQKTIMNYLDDKKPKQCSTDGPKDKRHIDKSKDGDKEVCVVIKPPVVTKDICELRRCMKDLGDTVINNYMTARDACAYYNKLVDETMTNFNMRTMKELQAAMNERMDLVKTSLENVAGAASQLSDLSKYLECGVQAPPDHIEGTKTILKDYQDNIKTIQILYEWENDKALVLDTHWKTVEATVDKYVSETQTMLPGVNYQSKRMKLSGDPDLLIYHTLRYTKRLRRELKDSVAGMTERVNRAVESLPQDEIAKKARCSAIQTEYDKKKVEMDKEFRKRYDDQKCANDKLLKQLLKKQLDRHEETLRVRLIQKEKEVMIKFNKMVADYVAAEKKKFATQLKEMALKLSIVEEKLNDLHLRKTKTLGNTRSTHRRNIQYLVNSIARLKAERETRRSQELWTAGASLLAATKKGTPYVKVDKELKAIEKASGDGDKLVLSVLKAIPPSVREKGIVPESVLREKYHTMERTALQVALVEQDGASLPIYWLSWLQSTLLFMKISGIPQKEFDNPPKEPCKSLDTFDLLQRARFWIERGNLAAALRYVSALEGASRAAAATWHDAARAHLEARQAAEAVLAHAAALGLQYI